MQGLQLTNVYTVASVIFITKVIPFSHFDRIYTVSTYQYTMQNVITNRKVWLRQSSKSTSNYRHQGGRDSCLNKLGDMSKTMPTCSSGACATV